MVTVYTGMGAPATDVLYWGCAQDVWNNDGDTQRTCMNPADSFCHLYASPLLPEEYFHPARQVFLNRTGQLTSGDEDTPIQNLCMRGEFTAYQFLPYD